MTYQGQQSRAGSIILRTLIVVTIIWVAYWSATGGLESIVVPDPQPATSTVGAG